MQNWLPANQGQITGADSANFWVSRILGMFLFKMDFTNAKVTLHLNHFLTSIFGLHTKQFKNIKPNTQCQKDEKNKINTIQYNQYKIA